MGLLEEIGEKIESMITQRPAFKAACEKCFREADHDNNGKISPKEAAKKVEYIFTEIEKDLLDYNIKVKKPTTEQVKHFLDIADKNGDYVLDEEEFFEFYKQVVKFASATSAKGFFRKYGVSMLAGIASMMVAKRGVASIPAAGTIVAPFMALLPSILVGPVLGVAVKLGFEKGDIMALKKELFPSSEDKAESKPQASGS
ncbi:hypothetical protein BSKO_06178 [Bryopsis sp. KO-2023]|nr:hypothetical protein BSKO_06178 [Bryopsis sp. KO-2023]